MLKINDIVRPIATADSEYSICGNTVLYKAKVVDKFTRKESGNNIKIEVLAHYNPELIGKVYTVDDRFFEIIPEWIWIDAYKGTDANMCCKDKQYEFGIEDYYDGNIVLGTKGYHVCTDLRHCFKTYNYDFHNRFFKVRALVRANEYEYRNPNNTTLVAKAIQFTEDITDSHFTLTAKRNAMR